MNNADLVSTLNCLSEMANVRLVIPDTIDGTGGKVSCSFYKVPWDQALDAITVSQGLSWSAIGENIDIVPEENSYYWEKANHTPSIMPVKGDIVTSFKLIKNPARGRRELHPGVDIAASMGSEVSATADGRVVFAGRDKKHRQTIVLDHGFGMMTYYCRLGEIRVKSGESVKRQQVIGSVGKNPGAVPHLHYEVHRHGQPENPYFYLD